MWILCVVVVGVEVCDFVMVLWIEVVGDCVIGVYYWCDGCMYF